MFWFLDLSHSGVAQVRIVGQSDSFQIGAHFIVRIEGGNRRQRIHRRRRYLFVIRFRGVQLAGRAEEVELIVTVVVRRRWRDYFRCFARKVVFGRFHNWSPSSRIAAPRNVFFIFLFFLNVLRVINVVGTQQTPSVFSVFNFVVFT